HIFSYSISEASGATRTLPTMTSMIHLPPVQNVTDFRIEQLFGSKTRARLLSLFLDNPERAYYVRELTREIDAQLNSVRRELKNLVDLGIVLEVEGKILPNEREVEGEGQKIEKKKFYRVHTGFPLFDDLRAVMKKSMVLLNNELVRLLREKGRVDLLLLTGRFTDAADVVIDLLIVGNLDPEVVRHAVGEFEKTVGREVNYTYMPKEDFTHRREWGDRFLTTVLQAKSIVLVNELGAV
ncbi:MAG: hypothetical protein Q7R47_02115, partial [Candidatus Diapherotrites archaeon]|nr:hypothetical protein [Candidatus Diapherotrites archaeon]